MPPVAVRAAPGSSGRSSGRRVWAEHGEYAEVFSGGELDLGAQFEALHARNQFVGAFLFAVEDQPIADFGETKIVEIFALRREECAIGGVGSRYPIDVLGDQSLEKRPPIGARDRHQSTFQFHISNSSHECILYRFEYHRGLITLGSEIEWMLVKAMAR
jgi:hypothetical protein